jgi:tagatose 1,6-diphosphate aldolase GatY/KbaY
VLASFSDLLAAAAERGAAVGAFTCYNLEQAVGVLSAAEPRKRGVILLVSEKSFSHDSGGMLLSALVAAAREARVPACVQLDHVRDQALIGAAFALGVGAVMADGSKLSLADNVEFVRAAVDLGRTSGGEVEAELGRIEGDEDVAGAVAVGALTDPDEAVSLAERTGAACLAVSIGNVHGVYRQAPVLDWPRLDAIRNRVPCALSLHGASGLSDRDIRTAIALGVVKVNINTELRRRYLEETADRLPHIREGFRLRELNLAQARAVADAVEAKLDLLSPWSLCSENAR